MNIFDNTVLSTHVTRIKNVFGKNIFRKATTDRSENADLSDRAVKKR
jgi:hypothetical protein